MPRRDDIQDDYDRPHPRKKDNTLLYVLLAVGGVAFLGCAGVGALVAFGWTRAVQDVQQQPAGFRQTMTRAEFRKAVEGKTPEEVIAAVGKPDRTSQSGGEEDWYYDRATTDPTTGHVDNKAQVVFRGGVVVSVNF